MTYRGISVHCQANSILRFSLVRIPLAVTHTAVCYVRGVTREMSSVIVVMILGFMGHTSPTIRTLQVNLLSTYSTIVKQALQGRQLGRPHHRQPEEASQGQPAYNLCCRELKYMESW
jgi:hypothetical protein